MNNNNEIINLCRACLCSSEQKFSFFTHAEDLQDESKNISDIYSDCTSLKVSASDGLPQNICQDCLEELVASYTFRNKCKSSEKELLKITETYIDQQIKADHIEDNNVLDSNELHNTIVPCLRCFRYYFNENDLIEHTKHEHNDVINLNVCCYCFVEYDNYKTLWDHVECDHLEDHLFECGYCIYQCSAIKEMFNHLFCSHSNDDPILMTIIVQGLVDESLNNDSRSPLNSDIQENEISKNIELKGDSIIENDDEDDPEYEFMEYLEDEENTDEMNVELETKYNADKSPENYTNNFTPETVQSYNCSICSSTYTNVKDLRQCMNSHNSLKQFRCHEKKCKQSCFTTQDELDIHNAVYHSTIVNNECPTCKKHYPSLKNLKAHMKTHTSIKNYKCRFCDKAFNFSHHLKNHEKIHDAKELYKCTVCEKGFITKDRLHLHHRIHSNYKPHKCSICGKAFISRSSLDIHYAKHTDEKPFMCNICGWRLKTEQFLRNHIKMKHSDQPKKEKDEKSLKELYCKICDVKYTDNAEYKNHIKEHCYKYKCEECNKPFALKNTYESHMKKHQNTGAAKHECHQCDASFHRPDLLRYHVIKNHSNGKFPYECEVCGRGFIQNSDYKTHTRRHSNKRLYECDICNKSYYTSSSLVQHKRTHTGEKPYACSICNATFTTVHQFNFHAKKHTSNDSNTILHFIREEDNLLDENLLIIHNDDNKNCHIESVNDLNASD